MGRADTLAELRQIEADFKEYAGILREGWRQNPHDGWWGAMSPQKRNRAEALRADLSRQYGRLRPALAEPQGGIPTLGNAYATAGDVFSVALTDPRANPWFGSALDGSLQTIAIAIGHFERTQHEDIVTLTSPVYWWRRSRGGLAEVYKEVKDWLGIIGKLKP